MTEDDLRKDVTNNSDEQYNNANSQYGTGNQYGNNANQYSNQYNNSYNNNQYQSTDNQYGNNSNQYNNGYNGPYNNQYQKQPSNSLAIASMIVGIIALLLSCYLGLIIGAVGLILGIVSLVKKYPGKNYAVAGILLSSFAILIGTSFLAVFFAAMLSVDGPTSTISFTLFQLGNIIGI